LKWLANLKDTLSRISSSFLKAATIDYRRIVKSGIGLHASGLTIISKTRTIKPFMAKVSTEQKKIDWLLNHAVENVYPNKDAVRERLMKGEVLTVYYGIDPTGPTLHLGHLITMRKLSELQELGHKVILLIGDFTAMIGDPTDKTATRRRAISPPERSAEGNPNGR
jgi:hypothetical protein